MSHNTKEQWHCFTLIFIPKRVRDAWQLCSSLPKSDSQIWCSGGSGGEELGPFPSWVRKEKRSCTVSVCYVSWSIHRQQAVKSYTEWKWSRFSHSVSKWYCCGPQDKTWLYLVLYGDMRADRNVVKLDHQSVYGGRQNSTMKVSLQGTNYSMAIVTWWNTASLCWINLWIVSVHNSTDYIIRHFNAEFLHIIFLIHCCYYLTKLSNHNCLKNISFIIVWIHIFFFFFHWQETGVRMNSHTLTAHSPHTLCSVLTK